MIYVIGSGPAGISCACALLQQGLPVTMLDAGIELEPERRQLVTELQHGSLDSWKPESLQVLKHNMTSNVKGIPEKLVYGSDFPFRDTDRLLAFEKHNVAPFTSLARGGLSNVWGSNVLPYTANDIEDWPISTSDLAPHYEAVLSFVNLSAVQDDLADRFPLYSNTYHPLRPSNQAAALLDDLNKNKSALNASGIFFGSSRLAVRAQPNQHQSGCVYCGLCMYGCPYELIYNSAFTLKKLLRNERFTYLDNIIVHRITESNGDVNINATSRDKDEDIFFKGTRVYLACGVLATTKILLESMGAFNTPVKLLDSQYFLVPMLQYKKTRNVDKESLHTLSQVYLEVLDIFISHRSILLEVYTYNDLYHVVLRNMFGPIYPLLKFPINELLSRLTIILGYLHSDVSPYISVTLIPGQNSRRNILRLESGNQNRITKNVIKRVIRKLVKNRSYLRAVPVSSLLQITEPGKSAHCGGTFPMRHQPSYFETDVLGRPYGFEHVHVVDATVFPSIPATTITLTVMANAHRIGSAFREH